MQIGDIDSAIMATLGGDVGTGHEEPPPSPRTTPTGIDPKSSSSESQPPQSSRIDTPQDGQSPVDDASNTSFVSGTTQRERLNVSEDDEISPAFAEAVIGISRYTAPSIIDTLSGTQKELPQIPCTTPKERLQEVVRLERVLDCCNTQEQRTHFLKKLHFNHLRALMVEAYKCRYRDSPLPREPAYKRICRQKPEKQDFYVLEKYCLDEPNLGLLVEDMQDSLFGNWSWSSPPGRPDPERGVATGPLGEREVYDAEPPVGETWPGIAKGQKYPTRKRSGDKTFCPFVERLRSFGRKISP